jgi:hypothetical protein
MNTWETITGVIILVVSLAALWSSYNTVQQCNSIGGRISTAITSIFGGTGAQACYNSGLIEVGSIITAIIGLIIIFAANRKSRR